MITEPYKTITIYSTTNYEVEPDMKFHPLADCLPILPGQELDELAEDIRKNGLLESITIFEKKILDGRNRYLACKKAKVKTRFEEYAGDDPVGFVTSHNVSRRHLTASQRAAYAVRILSAAETWASVGRRVKGSQDPISGEVAKSTGTSVSTVKRAKKIFKVAPEKFEQIQKGEKTVKEAAREIEAEKKAQMISVDAMGFPVPDLALPYWNRSDEVKDVLKQFSKLKSLADELHSRKDPMYCEVNLSFIRAELQNIYHNFKGALPFVVCTLCDGLKPEDCVLCHGRGVISQFRWEHALPQEDRNKREQQIVQLTQSNAA